MDHSHTPLFTRTARGTGRGRAAPTTRLKLWKADNPPSGGPLRLAQAPRSLGGALLDLVVILTSRLDDRGLDGVAEGTARSGLLIAEVTARVGDSGEVFLPARWLSVCGVPSPSVPRTCSATWQRGPAPCCVTDATELQQSRSRDGRVAPLPPRSTAVMLRVGGHQAPLGHAHL